MNWKALLPFFILISLSQTVLSQEYDDDEYYEEEEEEVDTARFIIGVNVGAFFANNNTAVLYSGSPTVTPYGIQYILDRPENQQTFRDYFQYNYAVGEYPIETKYRTSTEVGLHVGYKAFDFTTFFLDFNLSSLKYEQVFTIAIDDPNNGIVGPTYQQFPIFGTETRINVNLGAQISLHQGVGSETYLALFGNVNDVELNRNYIVIDDQQYEIFHYDPFSANQKPGGIGYGGGAGLGFRFNLTENILSDFYYNLHHTQSNLRENLQPYGTHHSFGLKVLWN